ncbi:MAG TPA: helix-turn-helix domain-containing protein [Gemmatimonadaceae bacterium]|nr:helix-turn-helix domain-containing protein [Gemmatimonadaceae bacterium]
MRADTDYITTQQLATNWKLSEWTVRELAKKGRIQGAEKPGRDWRFPADAVLLVSSSSPDSSRLSKMQALEAIRRLR